jgi:diguanylate cyclase (GGDEF)-like protein
LRAGDVLARWGGEEFMLLFPESTAQDGLANLELLRGSLQEATVSPQHPELRVRFSAGLTSFISGESIQKTIERADQALYQAKASGRNRCEINLEPGT